MSENEEPKVTEPTTDSGQLRGHTTDPRHPLLRASYPMWWTNVVTLVAIMSLALNTLCIFALLAIGQAQ